MRKKARGDSGVRRCYHSIYQLKISRMEHGHLNFLEHTCTLAHLPHHLHGDSLHHGAFIDLCTCSSLAG